MLGNGHYRQSPSRAWLGSTEGGGLRSDFAIGSAEPCSATGMTGRASAEHGSPLQGNCLRNDFTIGSAEQCSATGITGKHQPSMARLYRETVYAATSPSVVPSHARQRALPAELQPSMARLYRGTVYAATSPSVVPSHARQRALPAELQPSMARLYRRSGLRSDVTIGSAEPCSATGITGKASAEHGSALQGERFTQRLRRR